MSEIMITGGNGFVGRHVVSALLERGDRVRVLALRGEDIAWLERQGVAVFRGDVREAESLAEPMAGATAVVHLAAMMDVWRPMADYRDVNVTGTANVCEAALRAGVARVVHMSSSSVYSPAPGRALDEGAPLRPFSDPYPLTKAAADILVRRMVQERGLPAAVLRPDQIFGPGDELHFARMADRLRRRRGVIVGRGDNAVPLVFIADLVQGLLLCLDHPAAAGQAYNITSDQPLTQRELLGLIARAIGAPPPRLRLPYRATYSAGWLAERAAPLIGPHRRPPITRLGVAFMGRDQRFSIDKARRELGYSPQFDLVTGVHLAARWYLGLDRRPAGREQPAAPATGEARA